MSTGKKIGFFCNVCYVLIGLFVAAIAFALLKHKTHENAPEFVSSSVCPTDMVWTRPGELCVSVLMGKVEITRKDGVTVVIHSDDVTGQ